MSQEKEYTWKYDIEIEKEEKEMCFICNKNSAATLSTLCISCHKGNSDQLIFLLAKRIKALEEKLK